MKRPNFLGIGFPRAGTTYLWSVLRQHPQIFLPEEKEINFLLYQKASRSLITTCSISTYADTISTANGTTPLSQIESLFLPGS